MRGISQRDILKTLRTNNVSDKETNFHNKSINSALFKGRSDWYFCFLKSEKIAHVLVLLSNTLPGEVRGALKDVSRTAENIPQSVVHFAAGEKATSSVLAELLTLLSQLRLAHTHGWIGVENFNILHKECEQLIEKFSESAQLSPFTSEKDFVLPSFAAVAPMPLALEMYKTGVFESSAVKDSKGQYKRHIAQTTETRKPASKGQEERLSKVLDIVLKNKAVSIKDISSVIRDCSEKTLQRELTVLIARGLVKRVGDRRWSQYVPTL